MYGIVVGGSLNRRASASKTAASLGSYADGAYIHIENHNDEWYRTTFTYNGQTTTGYVMKAYVVKRLDTVKVRKTSVNVRNAANGSSILYTVNSGVTSTISAIEKVGDYGWIQGEFGGGTGWIRGDMFTKVSSNPNDTGETQEGDFILSAVFEGQTLGNNVRVRTGPGTNYASLDDPLTNLAFLDCQMITSGGTAEQRESWLKVNQSYNNVGSGYVYARYVTVPNNPNYSHDFPIHRINADSVNIRVRPSTNSESFAQLGIYEYVAVLETRSGWWRVGSDSGIGWVASQYID